MRDTKLGREVAVKVLPPELAADPDRMSRFRHEARGASALNHANIITLHEIGRDGTISYQVLELVQGKTLRELLAKELSKGPNTAAGRFQSRGASLDRQPAYSPEGERVVFSSNQSGNLDIWAGSTRRTSSRASPGTAPRAEARRTDSHPARRLCTR